MQIDITARTPDDEVVKIVVREHEGRHKVLVVGGCLSDGDDYRLFVRLQDALAFATGEAEAVERGE